MDKTELDFTGERFVPGAVSGDIVFEHYHRYALCIAAAAGRDVLDIACGDGYGVALMADGGGLSSDTTLLPRSVIGVDIDPATVTHATARYGLGGAEAPAGGAPVRFAVGSCDAIPIPDASVDLVTSFETIEHHDKHEEMMQEIRRVLRPGGLLILSSPNRRAYTEAADYHNPFHVRELDKEELLTLLGRYFTTVHLFGQRVVTGSLMVPQDTTGDTAFGFYARESLTRITRDPAAGLAGEATYFVTVCAFDASGTEALQTLIAAQPVPSFFAERDKEMAHWSDAVNEQMRQIHRDAEAAAQATRAAQSERDAALRTAAERQAEIEALQEAVKNRQAEIEARQAEIVAQQTENKSLRAHIAWMQLSPFWRMRISLRRLQGKPDDRISE